MHIESSGPVVDRLRSHGSAMVPVGWSQDEPATVIRRFGRLVDLVETSPPGRFVAIDSMLESMGAGPGRFATSTLRSLRKHEAEGILHTGLYLPGTLATIEGRGVALPDAVRTLWSALEAVFERIDRRLRLALRTLEGAHLMPSALRLWKYSYNGGWLALKPHYDATVFSALVASENPSGELLKVGLEKNGEPIGFVTDRVRDLAQYRPNVGHACCLMPGVFSAQWDLQPTWHYVEPLAKQDACRYSLIWSLLHPPGRPKRITDHIRHHTLVRLARRSSRGGMGRWSG